MTDLKRLADLVRGCDMLDADRDYLATLLRSAAGETVGTLLVEIGYAEACNNRNVYACRLALAAARKERDEAVAECERHRNDAFREADACRTITAERAALQRAIDEAIIFVEGHLTDENRRKLLAATLRPHATPSQPERAKEERQWRREYFSDRKFWMKWRDDDGARAMMLNDNPSHYDEGFVSLHDDTWCLPWQDGDTLDTLPPLPTEPKTGKEYLDAIGCEAAGSFVVQKDAPAYRPCDCRELVARLAEAESNLRTIARVCRMLVDGRPETEAEHARAIGACDAIIRDARGGGA